MVRTCSLCNSEKHDRRLCPQKTERVELRTNLPSASHLEQVIGPTRGANIVSQPQRPHMCSTCNRPGHNRSTYPSAESHIQNEANHGAVRERSFDHDLDIENERPTQRRRLLPEMLIERAILSPLNEG
ncbi:hypothetical protein BCR41DRAFT_160103 [Lobosporangium transversale]|uniref:Uncharacterized protein n=1 Tax=Lobosporangium transversale TaxID=64571 RepID=A0A1Y2GEE2_9FUNG|nr:hypothetical protein BCR41DRAFT_160103 [Lobosporangium transversale]ORZ07535.1 hypothetical protein BCR41DRAFT_160103 [Lobosporangium transversale]|eukprot:XP_021878042.1 hypothetical protein BCR41DRAFT_160103 [Lobosporangium transversale]